MFAVVIISFLFSRLHLSLFPLVLVQAVYEAMWELKSHEYIENHYIMDKLKERLQKKRVRRSRNASGCCCCRSRLNKEKAETKSFFLVFTALLAVGFPCFLI